MKDFNITKIRRKRAIFILLIIAVTILLCNMKVYVFLSTQWQQWHKTFYFQSSPALNLQTTPSPDTIISTTNPPPKVQSCSYTHLSDEHALEGRRLLDSITWPETAPVPKPFSLEETTSAAKSTFTIVPEDGGYHVGDELTVRIQVNDYHGNPKKGGGDFIISKLSNQQLGAGVVGQVQDHLNGTFTAVFPLLWNGTAEVEVTLVQSSESISVLKRLTEEQPDRIYFKSNFKSGSVTETAKCNICLDQTVAPVCNHTDVHTGEQWFCVRPKGLSCEDRVSHAKGGFNQRINKQEETLFQTGINMKAPIKALGSVNVTVLPKTDQTNVVNPGPVGYYYNNLWRPLGGAPVRQFSDAAAITNCLSGKELHLFGDSTIRQYYEHITKTLPNLKMFDRHDSLQSGPRLALDYTKDIKVTYRCHGPPIRYGNVPVFQLRYVANELDGLTGGPNTVVVIGVWSHFSTFPMEVYYQRLVTIRKSIKRLKKRAPGTRVVIRTANMKALTLDESLTNSDWYSYQRDKVLRAVFKDVDVLLLEAWELVQAHRLPHNLHPQPEIIKLMWDVMLSYMCPVKGR